MSPSACGSEGGAKAEIAAARRGDARSGAARTARRAQAGPALGRREAARRAGARAGQGPEAAAARRAADRARPQAARGDALRAGAHPAARRHHLPAGDPRPGRGDEHGEPHRRDGWGRIAQLGPPPEVYEQPDHRFVADFLGVVNLFARAAPDDGWRCRPEKTRARRRSAPDAGPRRWPASDSVDIAYRGRPLALSRRRSRRGPRRDRLPAPMSCARTARRPIRRGGDGVWLGWPPTPAWCSTMSSASRAVIALPYAWLALFFLLPFVAGARRSGVRHPRPIRRAAGASSASAATNYQFLFSDSLYLAPISSPALRRLVDTWLPAARLSAGLWHRRARRGAGALLLCW